MAPSSSGGRLCGERGRVEGGRGIVRLMEGEAGLLRQLERRQVISWTRDAHEYQYHADV